MFCTHNHASRQNYYKSPHEKPLIVQTKKFEGRKIMVWGCFFYYGVRKLVFLDTVSKSEDCINLLAENLTSSATLMGLKTFLF